MHSLQGAISYPINMGFDESRDQTPKIEKKKFFVQTKFLVHQKQRTLSNTSYKNINIYFEKSY